MASDDPALRVYRWQWLVLGDARRAARDRVRSAAASLAEVLLVLIHGMKRTAQLLAAAAAVPLLAGCGGGSEGSSTTQAQPVPGDNGSASTAVVSNLPAPVQLGVPFVVRDGSGVDHAKVTITAVELDPQCPKDPSESSYARASARGHFVSVEMDVETLPRFNSALFGTPSGHDFEVRDDSGYVDLAVNTDEQYCFEYEQIFQPMTAGGRYRGVVLLDTTRGASELVYRPFGLLGVPGWIIEVDAFAGDAPPREPLGMPANEFTVAPMYTPSYEPMPTIVQSPLAPVAPSDQAKTVVYEVISNGALSSVTWFDEDSALQQDTSVSASWSRTVKNSSTYVIAGLGAQTNGTSVTCRITVDGTVVDTQTATGKYAVVNCTDPMS